MTRQFIDYGLRGESIICFAGEDYWYHHPHEKTHLFKRLAAQGNRILFINSLTVGLPAVSHPDFFLKIRNKLKSYLHGPRHVPEGFWVMTPVVIPLFGSKAATYLNRLLLLLQVKVAMNICGMSRPVVWVHIPTAADIAEHLDAKLIIYQITDKLEAQQDSTLSSQAIREMDGRLKRLADVVLYSSKLLYDESDCPQKFLISQGVDFDLFSQEPEHGADDVIAIPHPVLGYFGSMDYVMDPALMAEVLRRRADWHWAMIGNKSNLMQISAPNLHFLGPKPYELLPSYIKHFDVCILPWQDNRFTRYGSAMKVRDYMASGKPVVMFPLYEYKDEPGLRFFTNADEFIAAVQDALDHDSPRDRYRRCEAVRYSTWDDKARRVGQLIQGLLDGQPVVDERRRPLCRTGRAETLAVNATSVVTGSSSART